MLPFIGRLLISFLVVAIARVRRGPRRPTWSFGFEVLVEALRRHTAWLVSLPTPELRAAANQMRGPLSPGVAQRQENLAGVPVTWFEPTNAVERVLLYIHGGGHVFGSAEQDRGIASTLASLTGMRVVAPDYRLAPEAACPADIDDLMAVCRLLLSQAVGVPSAVVGLSSGGAAALSLLARFRDEGMGLPERAVLLSPMVDAAGMTPSWTSNSAFDWVAPDAGRRWAKQYAGTRSLRDPVVSPVHAQLDGLPPILVIAGEAELLRDDAVHLAERARACGTPLELHVEPDMVHAFMTFGRRDPATHRSLERIKAFLCG